MRRDYAYVSRMDFCFGFMPPNPKIELARKLGVTVNLPPPPRTPRSYSLMSNTKPHLLTLDSEIESFLSSVLLVRMPN